MSDHDIVMDDYEVSKWRYRELRAFARQYDEKKSEASRAIDHSLDGRGHTVEKAALRRERILKDIRMIERIAQETDGGRWAGVLIDSCCRGLAYQYLDQALMPSSDRNAFFRARREFFWRLSLELR